MTKVYYMVDEHARVKIGVSYHPGIRLKAIQPTRSGLLTLVATEPGGRRREAELHVRLAHLHIHHEWFFLQDDLLEYVTSISDDVRRAVEELPTKETATRNVIREKLVAPAQEESERIIRDAQRKGAAIISKARRLPPQKAHKEAQRIVTTAKTEAQALLLKA